MVQETEENIKYEGGKRQSWDDITPEYLTQVAQKIEGAFEDSYEEGMNSFTVEDIIITEINRENKSKHKENATFRIEFNINFDPEYDDDIKECCTTVTSPVEYDSTNITSFEDKVYDAIDKTIENVLDEEEED